MIMQHRSALCVCHHLPNILVQDCADMVGVDVRSEGVWDDYHIVDGRIVTGMNPQSAKSTAKAAVEVFEKQQ
jgi:putative intracellular protease/amidase